MKSEGCITTLLKAIGILLVTFVIYFLLCWLLNSDGFVP